MIKSKTKFQIYKICASITLKRLDENTYSQGFSENTIVLPEFRNDLKTDFKNVLNYFGFDEPFFC